MLAYEHFENQPPPSEKRFREILLLWTYGDLQRNFRTIHRCRDRRSWISPQKSLGKSLLSLRVAWFQHEVLKIIEKGQSLLSTCSYPPVHWRRNSHARHKHCVLGNRWDRFWFSYRQPLTVCLCVPSQASTRTEPGRNQLRRRPNPCWNLLSRRNDAE